MVFKYCLDTSSKELVFFVRNKMRILKNENIQESPCEKMIECNNNTPTKHVLSLEDVVSSRYLSNVAMIFKSLHLTS